ncbi:ATP-grasp fold amidoligase family protein [Congregibacter sp.]|jgi:hypothetical protein|uniref:ATP-grasp fold amidoligase family protein n=1 Tax=Congregibacter sp. TaxID=2744308 RepID=UPI0039E6620C
MLNLLIAIKWRIDSLLLPLVSRHRGLYQQIHRAYWSSFRSVPNLIRPKSFNDKMQWLKLFDQTEECVRCIDKYEVRSYVSQRVGDKCLTNLYQLAASFEEIDFGLLPVSFVVKATHDSGSVLLVNDVSEVDKIEQSKRFRRALADQYGEVNAEWGYMFVHPRIMVEEYLEPHSPNPPADYKFHCCDGKIAFLQYISGRHTDPSEVVVFPDGQIADYCLFPELRRAEEFSPPDNYAELQRVAEALSKGHKYVRVDLYSVEGQVYFGELTFWPYGGFYQGVGQACLGSEINFDLSETKTPLHSDTISKHSSAG